MATGFWNHSVTAGSALSGTGAAMASPAGAKYAAASSAATSGTGGSTGATGSTGTSGSTGSTDDSSTISANDFLTLLVTEMQNQDPTANQDPNEYINQLVQVNSLEQLIDINQTLTTGLGGTTGGATSGTGSVTGAAGSATGQASGATPSGAAPGVAGLTPQNTLSQIQGAARAKASAMTGAPPLGSGAAGSNPAATFAARLRHAPGNLAVPEAKPAANHVAHALDGQSRKHPNAVRHPGV